MNMMEAIQARHSVRSYTDQAIEGSVLQELRQAVEACNQESGLSIQLCINEPDAFAGMMARYGRFVNVRNYVALVGPKGPDLEEKCGYYGEKIVLKAQQLGLNTCWVAMSYSKGKSTAKVGAGEKLLMVISLGYGATQGVLHTSKPLDALAASRDMPAWFQTGLEAAQLAPTAMNQQKFRFELLEGNQVKAQPGSGFYTKVDLGIAKCHFEIGAGSEGWGWAQ